MLARCIVLGLVCGLGGCTGDDGSRTGDADASLADAGPGAALPSDVDAVLAARCRKCHSDPPRNFAPFPLVTWQDTHAPAPAHDAQAVYEVIAERIHDPGFPMPPAGNPMTDADRKVLDDWIAQGAPPAR